MFLKCLGFCYTSKSQEQYPTVIEELCDKFSLADLRKSTNNFDEKQKIGSGNYGTVYKGCLQHNGATVAVKRMHRGYGQGFGEFKNEIELLCQLRHPNIVSLLGFYNSKDEKILVYEYTPNGCLHDRLYGMKMDQALSWKIRLKICIGAARGLHFLHTGAKRTIYHRDINPFKILLDNNMVPKLTDFRVSLQGQHFKSKPKPKSISNDHFIGTHGYEAPEIAQNKTLTDKCDVYSFGVVLLEVVCRNKLTIIEVKLSQPVEENIDPYLRGKIAPECWQVFMDVTDRCLKYDPNERPTIGEVEVQLEHALLLQEEADIRKTCDHYTLLSTTVINPISERRHF